MKKWAFEIGAALAIVSLFVWLKVTDDNYKPSCYIISSDANHGPILAGNYTYDGIFWANKTTKIVLGFSQYEDSIIYNNRECANKEEVYVK